MFNLVPNTAATDPVILGPGKFNYHDVCIDVYPGTGSVLLEMWSPVTDDWALPTAEGHTITTQGTTVIERANRPPMRIRATGDARFYFFGSKV